MKISCGYPKNMHQCSGSSLVLVMACRCQAITWINTDLLSIKPLGTNLRAAKFESNYNKISLKKCIWKCSVLNDVFCSVRNVLVTFSILKTYFFCFLPLQRAVTIATVMTVPVVTPPVVRRSRLVVAMVVPPPTVVSRPWTSDHQLVSGGNSSKIR